MQFSQEHILTVQSKVNLWVTPPLPDSPLYPGAGSWGSFGGSSKVTIQGPSGQELTILMLWLDDL